MIAACAHMVGQHRDGTRTASAAPPVAGASAAPAAGAAAAPAEAAPVDVAAAPEPPAKPRKKKKRGLFGKIAGAVGDAVKGVANLGKRAVAAVGSAVSDAAGAAKGVLDSTAGQWLRRAAGAVLTFVAPPVGLAITAANGAYDGIVNGDWKGALTSAAALAGGAGLISGQAALAAQQGVTVIGAVERGDAVGAVAGALGGAAGITGDPGLASAASTARDVAKVVDQGSRVIDAVEAAGDGDIAPAVATLAQLAA